MMRIAYDICVLLCLAMLGFGIHLVLDEQRRVMSFSAATTAIVLKKHVEHRQYPNADPESTDDFEPVVTYRYEFGGRFFTNTSIFPSSPLQHDAAFADATVSRFRIGQETPVYYNPGDPGQACLIRRPSLPIYFSALGSVIILGVVACFSRPPRPGDVEDNRRKGRWLAALWHLVGLAGAAHYFHLAGADYTAGAPWLFGLYTYVGLIPVAVALPSSRFALRVKNGIAFSFAGAGVGGLVGVFGGVLAGLLPGHRLCAFPQGWVGYGVATGAVLLAALAGWADPPAPPRRNKTEEEEGDLSRLLRPEDFAAVGVTGAGAPSVNSRGPDSAYVVFAGASGATGGIEFDVFRSQNPESVFANAAGELPDLAVAVPVREVGADDAVLATGLDNSRGGKWAGITVRKGNLVFGISIPDSPQVRAQLIALAKLVLARANKQAKPERD